VPVDVRIPTMLRAHTGGAASVAVEGSTIREVVEHLVGAHPGLGGQIVTPDGTLHKFVNVYLNDDDIRYLDKLDTKVGEGDTISILPAVAGGS
jgi:molybdopterin converting factor small subunit